MYRITRYSTRPCVPIVIKDHSEYCQYINSGLHLPVMLTGNNMRYGYIEVCRKYTDICASLIFDTAWILLFYININMATMLSRSHNVPNMHSKWHVVENGSKYLMKYAHLNRDSRHHERLRCSTHWEKVKITDSAYTIFKSVFLNANFPLWLKSHWNMLPTDDWTISQHWFRWSVGSQQAKFHYLNQW